MVPMEDLTMSAFLKAPRPELALAFACCRWPLTESGARRIVETAARVENWDRFLGIVRRNRIAPLVHHALEWARCDLPAEVRRALAQKSLHVARQALAMARETLRLHRTFESAQLPVMIVKGAPLALLAYGELGLKDSWDIDVLTSRDAVPAATKLLADFGYESALVGLSKDQLAGHLRHSKEAEFHHPETRITVELHWSMVELDTLLQGVDIDAPTQDVAMAGGALRTLAGDQLYAYLCVHGGLHCWSRLKWLADLRALLGDSPPGEIERLHRRAAEFGAERSSSVALLLCNVFLDLPLQADFVAELRRDFIVGALCRNALACLSYGEGAAEHDHFTTARMRTTAAQLFLVPGTRHGLAQLRYLWNSPVDRIESPLPARLEFLYPFVRLPLWIGRVGRDLLRARQ
jgi:hypothetical protein